MNRKFVAVALIGAVLQGRAVQPVLAQDAPEREMTRADGVEITLHRFDWLRPDDLAALTAIAQSPEARFMLLGPGGDYAALALAPAEGLLAPEGVSASAQAVAQLPDAATARARALELCDDARRGGQACAVVLEVAPIR